MNKGRSIIRVIILIVVLSIVIAWGLQAKFDFHNEWPSFLGSYIGGAIGGIGTLLAVYFTFSQTNDIQKKIIKRENDDKLKEMRTIVEVIPVKSTWGVKDYRKMVYGDRLIQTKDYMEVNKICLNESIGLNIREYLRDYEDYPFIIIRNIGRNPMCKIKVDIDVCDLENEDKKDKFSFGEYCINSNNSVVYPIFKIDNNLNLKSFGLDKIKIKYTTSMIGMAEEITFTEEYSKDENNKDKRKISIIADKKTIDEEDWEIDYMNFSHMLKIPKDDD